MSSTPVETSKFLGMLRRMIRAAARRSAQGDVEDLVQLLELDRELADAIVATVRGLRASGWTWSALGAATGTSKEAAVQKWATKVKDVDPAWIQATTDKLMRQYRIDNGGS